MLFAPRSRQILNRRRTRDRIVTAAVAGQIRHAGVADDLGVARPRGRQSTLTIAPIAWIVARRSAEMVAGDGVTPVPLPSNCSPCLLNHDPPGHLTGSIYRSEVPSKVATIVP